MKQGPPKGQAALRKNLSQPSGDKKSCLAALAVSPNEAPPEGPGGLGIEALRRENEKFLEAEVAKWNSLTPDEKPFEWKGKSAAEILTWRNARLKQLRGLREGACQGVDGQVGSHTSEANPLQTVFAGAPVAYGCLRTLATGMGATEKDTAEAKLQALALKHQKTSYEEKLARWKRAILEEKIIDLDDAAFEEKFAEWHTHALRLEAIKQEIGRLEQKAVELKIEELKEQAAKQQAELEKAAKKTNT